MHATNSKGELWILTFDSCDKFHPIQIPNKWLIWINFSQWFIMFVSMINSTSPHSMRAMPVLRCRNMHLIHDQDERKHIASYLMVFFSFFFLFILNFCSLFLLPYLFSNFSYLIRFSRCMSLCLFFFFFVVV